MARKGLIIDDEAPIRKSLSGALKDEGFEVMTAGSGEEGLGYVSNGSFDAVMLDVWMPGIDGLETLKRIAARAPSLPVIMVTVNDDVATTSRLLELGAADYVPKPFELRELLARVRALLRRASYADPVDEMRVADLRVDVAARRAWPARCISRCCPRTAPARSRPRLASTWSSRRGM